jgi:hypothetical protein
MIIVIVTRKDRCPASRSMGMFARRQQARNGREALGLTGIEGPATRVRELSSENAAGDNEMYHKAPVPCVLVMLYRREHGGKSWKWFPDADQDHREEGQEKKNEQEKSEFPPQGRLRQV